MYPCEERMQAVKAYIALEYQANQTIRELGYPSHEALRSWCREYRENGDLHRDFIRAPLHTEEQKAAAVAHYYANGCNLSQDFQTPGVCGSGGVASMGAGNQTAGGTALYLQTKCRKKHTRAEARGRGGILHQRRQRRKDLKQIRIEPPQFEYIQKQLLLSEISVE